MSGLIASHANELRGELSDIRVILMDYLACMAGVR